MARRAQAAKRSGEPGQVLTLVALVMAVLLAMLALAIDLGFLFHYRRQAQTAADAAVRAAVVHLYPANRDDTKALSVALSYASQNGFNNNGTDNTVTVSLPPLAGAYTGNTNYIEVSVTRSFPTIFLAIISRDLARASARAVAGVRTEGTDIAMAVLSSSACPAARLSSGSRLTVTGGRLVINGTCSQALQVRDTSSVTAPSIEIVGSYQRDAGATISPLPQVGVSPVADPLASLPAPSFSGLTIRHGSAASPSTWEFRNGTTTLNPGIYYGGLRIRDTATVTFQAGTYIMAGGGLAIYGTARVTGSGVFIYNTRDPSTTSGDGAFRQVYIDLDSPGSLSFSAPTSGTYTGLLFFQDRTNTQRFQLRGSLATLTGTLYFPSAVAEARVAAGTQTAQFVVQEFEMSSSGSAITVNYDSSLSYGPPQGYLSE